MYYVYFRDSGKGLKKKIVSFFIRITTGKFRHVEIKFPKELYKKNCFSASGYDKKVRYKTINFSHPKRWYNQLIGYFTKEQIGEIRNECNKYIGMPYALKDAILRFGFGKKVDDPDTW